MTKGDQDELSEINGVKPNVYLKDTEETEVAGSGCGRLLCNSFRRAQTDSRYL
jgi:hypothetical protein